MQMHSFSHGHAHADPQTREMAAQQPRPPVKASEVLQLAQLGVPADALKFRNVSIESEKAVVIRDEAASEIKIIDLATKATTKLPNVNNAIDGAIMHPSSKVIGLRAGNKLVIRNLEMQSDMKKVAMTGNVVFWRWLVFSANYHVLFSFWHRARPCNRGKT